MKKHGLILVAVVVVFLAGSVLDASSYVECFFTVKINKVIRKVAYNKKAKVYNMRLGFTMISCKQSPQSFYNICKYYKKKDYIKEVIVSNKNQAGIVKPGAIVRIKYESASGFNSNGPWSHDEWKLVQ